MFNFKKFSKGFQVIALSACFVVALSGCGKGSGKNVKIDGVDGPKVAFIDNKLTMTVILKNVQMDGGLRLPMPHMQNSYFEIGPDFQSTGTLLSVGIDAADLKFIKDNLQLLDPTRLPGGRPLPGVAEGQLPALAIQVPKLNDTVFYFSPSIFGAFVPVDLGMKDAIATFRFYDDAGDPIGNISVVGQDANSKNAGFLLLINISLGSKVAQVAKL